MKVVAFIGTEWIVVIVVVAVLLFGGTQIPKLFRGLGQAKREFEKGMRDSDEPVQVPKEAPTKDARDA